MSIAQTMQEIHDMAIAHGAQCFPYNTDKALHHARAQQIHDAASANGARCVQKTDVVRKRAKLPDKVSASLQKRREEIAALDDAAQAQAVANALDTSKAAVLRHCLASGHKIVGHGGPNWYRR
jgi:hypothetical protein